VVQHLSLTRAELEASIPASLQNSTAILKDPNFQTLKACLDKLNTSMKKSNEIVDTLRKFSSKDDIGPRLMQACAESETVNEDTISDEQLNSYQNYAKEIDESIKLQESLLVLINVRW
jgi:programmed cell death 6-interacting protein